MSAQEIWNECIQNLKDTSLLEFTGVAAGIASVWFSRKENILVYPVGLINTIIYVYISLKGSLFGEASVNLYYTIMSIYGWVLWAKKDERHQTVLQITYSSAKEWLYQLLFFATFYIGIFAALTYLKQVFYSNTVPYADAFASATAYTGMWLMAKKKVESWWWIATNVASIPLYFIKGYVFTSVQYIVLLVLAVMGLLSWTRRVSGGKTDGLLYASD
ncbi:nicotinamide mononucleotide transporter [Ilyomonas limi]|uniref:Nicotinamide riboside transporter PnuC n=1 Tax=Ilyomonas limi TaxID=2575867 RepID=A0A4U3KUF4_9BACT|nr:nicotinamide riboside transporter PnuC [Ilyomonas limi]TKK66010.1 nicotinamide mononucleotide transporter [Ilyomonas limi]